MCCDDREQPAPIGHRLKEWWFARCVFAGDAVPEDDVAKVWASSGTSQAMFQTGREAEFVQALKE
jgi:hypothetical protein